MRGGRLREVVAKGGSIVILLQHLQLLNSSKDVIAIKQLFRSIQGKKSIFFDVDVLGIVVKNRSNVV